MCDVIYAYRFKAVKCAFLRFIDFKTFICDVIHMRSCEFKILFFLTEFSH